MKKRLLAATLAATLASAGIAEAASTDLFGTTDGGGSISMIVVRDSSITVTGLQFSGVPIKCNRGKFKLAASITSHVFPVDSVGRFEGVFWPGQHNPPPNKLRIHGKLTNGGNAAHGTLRLHGDKVVVENRKKKQNGCDTGKVGWTAAAA